MLPETMTVPGYLGHIMVPVHVVDCGGHFFAASIGN
jgi:hypothetical protein